MTRAGLPQTVNHEIPSFNDQLLLLRPHFTAEPVTTAPTTVVADAPYDHSAADESQHDDVVLDSIRGQCAHNGTGPSPSSSSPNQTAPNGMDEFDEDYRDDTNDVPSFKIERATEEPTESDPDLKALPSNAGRLHKGSTEKRILRYRYFVTVSCARRRLFRR